MKRIVALSLALLGTFVAQAYRLPSSGGNEGPGQHKSANCPPSTEFVFMDFNNVKTQFQTNGQLWLDRANGRASYEVPRNSNRHILYAGGLWMGGEDINGQLKLAAVLNTGSGYDFWAGPLSVVSGSGNYNPNDEVPASQETFRDWGAATITPETCQEYDRFFTIRKQEVQQFVSWFQCNLDPQCSGVEAPSQEVMDRISSWPAHGDPSKGQDYYLAPFKDYNNDGEYNPADGDYPWYDLEDEIDCRNDRRVTLYGDETHWWVFNDRGDIHTITQGEPIGMEIHAQAFAFATNDEVNNMTFYNYELINRGTQTLYNTYFAQYADGDIGGYDDDYVGCDVMRGLGFIYNGDNDDKDAAGNLGYGANPPAMGIDFFEGPYQDNDGSDNPVGIGFNEALNGIGYGDGVVDNERYGMRRFVYFSGGGGGANPATTDPIVAVDYYNYMRSIWKDQTNMLYGGNGHQSDASTSLECDFMFPGSSDTAWNWGTGGQDPGFSWTEEGEGNQPYDRRFVQAAGPFTLKPGALNNITVGVVYGRAAAGGNVASVDAMKQADTKAQALFDNCFQILEPPYAPQLVAQELENELVLYLDNPQSSNNYNEEYIQEDDINIPATDLDGNPYDRFYRFQGYQIYQLKDATVSIADIEDVDKARLVAQTDISDGVSRLINYDLDELLGVSVPTLKVDGENEGIQHSFRLTEDYFASGDRALVNHKKYYFIAVSYAYNNFKNYDPDDPQALDGQKKPYLRSRLGYNGQGIEPIVVIPHNPTPEADGTIFGLSYGDGPEITRIEGDGNGGNVVDLTPETEAEILANNVAQYPVYRKSAGPINVKVIDPLLVQPNSDYTLVFNHSGDVDTSDWVVTRRYTDANGVSQVDSFNSMKSLDMGDEQLILDWGISITLKQAELHPETSVDVPQVLEATIEFADSSKIWLTGIPDGDTYGPLNWIRSGDVEEDVPSTPASWSLDPEEAYNNNDRGFDRDNNYYEDILGGTVAPFKSVGWEFLGMPAGLPESKDQTQASSWRSTLEPILKNQSTNKLSDLHSVDIVITSDKSKWTRVPVLEMHRNSIESMGNAEFWTLRDDESVDKDGRRVSDAGVNTSEATLTASNGMGWFPGYAIDVETGERLNMAFGENSLMGGEENGRDMMWNPSSNYFDNGGNTLFGGMHWVYIFRKDAAGTKMPTYDNGAYLYSKINNNYNNFNVLNFGDVWRHGMWVMSAMQVPDQDYLATDVRVRLRVNREYMDYQVDNSNATMPSYEWSFEEEDGIRVDQSSALDSTLSMIGVVPNPYYGYSEYETDKLDTRIKITNLPERCDIKIYNVRGGLIRTFKKDDPLTSLDWNLKNHADIPVAGGLYLIHVMLPDGRETVVKSFITIRQPALENF